MPGPPPKAAGRQRRSRASTSSSSSKAGKSSSLSVLPSSDVTSGSAAPPAPPKGLRVAARKSWESFWRSPVAAAVDRDADLGRLIRWIENVDEYQRMIEAFRKTPLVKGSTGQPRLNPLRDRLNDLERSIAAAEDAFGMTPIARLRLGVAVGDAHRSLEGILEDLASPDPEGWEDDPRAVAPPMVGADVVPGEVVDG